MKIFNYFSLNKTKFDCKNLNLLKNVPNLHEEHTAFEKTLLYVHPVQ